MLETRICDFILSRKNVRFYFIPQPHDQINFILFPLLGYHHKCYNYNTSLLSLF